MTKIRPTLKPVMALLATGFIALALGSCGDDDNATVTATPSASASPTATATATTISGLFSGDLGEFTVAPGGHGTHKVVCPAEPLDLYTPAVARMFPPDLQPSYGTFTRDYAFDDTGARCGFEGYLSADGIYIQAVPFTGHVTVVFEAPRDGLESLDVGGKPAIGRSESYGPGEVWVIVRNARGSGSDILLMVQEPILGLDHAIEIANSIVSEW